MSALPAARGGDVSPHRRDHLGIVGRTEDGGAGDEGVGAGGRDLADVVDLDAAVDLETDIQSRVVDDLAGLIVAVILERRFTKDEIIASYLNTVSFVGNSYGIQNGAKIYFQKEAADLDVHEAALLIASAETLEARGRSDLAAAFRASARRALDERALDASSASASSTFTPTSRTASRSRPDWRRRASSRSS